MSVRFDSITDGYDSSSVGITASGWAVTLWAKLQVDRNDRTTLFMYDNVSNATVLQTQSNGTSLQVHDGTTDGLFSASLTVGAWKRLGLVRTSTTSVTLYSADATGVTSSQTVSTASVTTPTRLIVGNSAADEWLNGNVANLKAHAAVLTQVEVEAEWDSWDAVRTANLVRHHKFKDAAETTDYSGNGRTLTVGGSPTFDSDNPPITENSISAAFIPILLF